MRVAFSALALASVEAWRTLDRILDLLGRGRHLWHIDDFTQVNSSAWLSEDSRTTRMNRELLKKAFTAQAYSNASLAHTLLLTVTPLPSQENELTPEHTAAAMHSPVFLVLENAGSDAAFVRAVAWAYNRDNLLDGLEDGAIVVDNAGGFGGLRPAVERLLARQVPGPVRIAVLRDGDMLHPDAPHSQIVTDLVTWCTANSVHVHVLRKRETENYLPLEALGPPPNVPAEHAARASRCYQAFLTL